MKSSTFEAFSRKEVINIRDGKILGYPCDLLFDTECGQIISFFAKDTSRLFCAGKKNITEIPWSSITKIGDDIILVDTVSSIPCPLPAPKKEKKYFFGG